MITPCILLFLSCNINHTQCWYQYTKPPKTLEQRLNNYVCSLAYLGNELTVNPLSQNEILVHHNAYNIIKGKKFRQYYEEVK